MFTAKHAENAKHRRNLNSELNTNSYELRIKYFQLSGAPIENDATFVY
jgi:hypothetical protein